MGDAIKTPERSSSTVAIIGAGPVGLYAALLLGRAGIDVHIFEREDSVLQSPRAIAYFPVVLDDFKRAGIFEDVCKAGYINTNGVTWRRPGGEKLAHLGGGDPTKFAVHLGQHELAEIIMVHLKNYPHVKLRFGNTLERIEQTDKSNEDIKSFFSSCGPNKTQVEHSSRFLIGADGGRSTVRKLLNIPLEGFTWDDFNIIATNIVYDLESYSDWGSANFIVDPEYWSVVAKTGKGPNWRVATGLRIKQGINEDSWDEAKAVVTLRERLRVLLPGPVEEAEIVKMSPYKMHQRCVPSFRKGNIVLAGDAAHLTNPTGGLGLTTGLMDSSFLADVLQSIIGGGQPSDLLNVYADIRRKVFTEFTSPTATRNRQRLCGTDPEAKAERDDFFARLNKPDIPFLMKLFEEEMEIATSSSHFPWASLPENQGPHLLPTST